VTDSSSLRENDLPVLHVREDRLAFLELAVEEIETERIEEAVLDAFSSPRLPFHRRRGVGGGSDVAA
jgi:hypothetical protein